IQLILISYVCVMENKKYNVPVVLTHINDDAHNFKPLPTPTGEYPYRLNIAKIIGKTTNEIQDRMFFHMVGDTGSVRHSDFQATVAHTLAQQIEGHPDAQPTRSEERRVGKECRCR